MSETSKARILFWIRMLSWVLVGYITPILVFAYKFGLFTVYTTQYDELGNVIPHTDISLNGWGIVSVLLIGGLLSTILKELANAYKGYSFIKQCYVGVCKTIPLIITFAIFYFLSGVVDQVMFCLIVLIICRLASIPLNPLPKWRHEKQGKEDYSTIVEVFTDFVKTHVKRGGS